MTMNERAERVADELAADADRLRVAVSSVAGVRVIDCGGAVTGSLAAGVKMARVCLADLADVSLVPGDNGVSVQVWTDDPVRACLGSQYAGWQVKADRFFAMGSGPMRALAAREEVIKELDLKEEAACAVGCLETRKHPTDEVVASIVAKLPNVAEKLTLLVAPACSIAGTLQVVARSVETALHKLHELKFDVKQVQSGYGTAPLPPVAADELAAIGRTNDAILYGGRVTLWVRADDEVIDAIGPQVPSSASKDHGELFAELFARYGDFYKIDPLLFSPAEVTFVNLKTGRTRTFGKCEPALLRKSFASQRPAMNLAILSGGTGWHVQDLLRAAGELGHTAAAVDFRTLFADHTRSDPLADFDAIIVRTMPAGSLEQIVFRMDLLQQAISRGQVVLNPPRAVETCVDKFLTDHRLRTAGLPVPVSTVCQRWQDAMPAFDALGGDVVVKPLFGSEGRGMVRVTERELAWRTFHAIEQTGGVIYLQRFIRHPGWDVRAFVLNGRVLGAMRRTANGDWRTNVAQGGSAEACELTAEQVGLALAATEAVGAVVAGVDLLCDERGEWYVIEVNAVPGWRALSAACGVDVAKEVVGAACRAALLQVAVEQSPQGT